MRENVYFHGVDKNCKTENRAEQDYYSTPPEAVEYLLNYESFSHDVLEPCVGGGAIADVLTQHGYQVTCIDIVDRGYPDTIVGDFLKYEGSFDGDVITNPPYNIQTSFVLKCLGVGRKVALLLKLSFLETIDRYDSIFCECPPNRVYVFVKRISCLKNGEDTCKGSSVCYCWYVWDQEAYSDDTLVYWIPNHK